MQVMDVVVDGQPILLAVQREAVGVAAFHGLQLWIRHRGRIGERIGRLTVDPGAAVHQPP